MEENPTSEVLYTPDPNSAEAQYFSEEATEGDNTNETEVVEQPKQPEIDYKEKFSASTRENQRILAEQKALQSALKEREARLEAIEKENAEYEAFLKGERPEMYETVQVKKELNELKKDIILQKEKLAIDEFISNNPDAKLHKEALKTLGRANPDKSYDEIYSSYIKPIYEAGIKDYEVKVQTKKQI